MKRIVSASMAVVGMVAAMGMVPLVGADGGLPEKIPQIDISGLQCTRFGGSGDKVTRPSAVPELRAIPGYSGSGDGIGLKLTGYFYKEVAYFDFLYVLNNEYWYIMAGTTGDPFINCNPTGALPCQVPYADAMWAWIWETERAAESGNLTQVQPPPEPDPTVNCSQ